MKVADIAAATDKWLGDCADLSAAECQANCVVAHRPLRRRTFAGRQRVGALRPRHGHAAGAPRR